MTEQTKTAFIALIGAPNAGKSTLLNCIVGQKISIVTPKVQTTRFRISGVYVHEDVQLVFTDTPGIFTPKGRLDKAMVKAAWSGASEADSIALLVDAKKGLDDNTRAILDTLVEYKQPVVVLLNKIDRVSKESLLGLTAALQEKIAPESLFMISAKTGDGVEDVLAFFRAQAEPGPWFFPEDQLTDIHERLFATELTREQLFLRLKQELPYALTVDTETWEEKEDGSVVIHQNILVEREAQKKIVLGKQGAQIKAISQSARRQLEEALDRKVHLFLFVKVRDNWKEKPELYKGMGLDF